MPCVAEGFFARSQFHVRIDHHGSKLFDAGFRNPAQFFLGFGWIAQEEIDLCRAEIAGVELDMIIKAQAGMGKGEISELAHADGLAGGDDIIIGRVLLEHHPHHFDIVASVAPVAFGIEVAQEDFVLQTHFDSAYGAGDFAGDEGFASAG